MQHRIAFEERPSMLESTGFYYYRKGGEQHAWNPESIHLMQWAVRNGDYEKYKKFAAYVNKFNQRPHFIRGFFEFKKGTTPVPIEEVEPAENIFTRLSTGAMSFGSLGKEVHEALAIAMNSLGALYPDIAAEWHPTKNGSKTPDMVVV